MKFKSQVFTQVSGSVGGITYGHNAAGLFTRARTIPVNTNTPAQQAVRSNMSALVNVWISTLTAAQRAAWDVYASNVTVTDKLGDQINISGQNHFIRSNSVRLQAGLARVDVAPVIFSLGQTDPSLSIAPTAATDDLVVTFDAALGWAHEAGGALIIQSGVPQNPSVVYFNGPYRFASAVLGDAVTPPTSPASVISPFPLATGQTAFARARISRADGRLSSSFRVSAATAA